jgi:hypothetical protein
VLARHVCWSVNVILDIVEASAGATGVALGGSA